MSKVRIVLLCLEELRVAGAIALMLTREETRRCSGRPEPDLFCMTKLYWDETACSLAYNFLYRCNSLCCGH